MIGFLLAMAPFVIVIGLWAWFCYRMTTLEDRVRNKRGVRDE